MKLLLTTLNSKYVHSCLAIRYLRGYAKDLVETELREFTINQNIDYIVSEIYKSQADLVTFSTYIWNLNETLDIAAILRLIRPDIKIVLGGPEVSFDGTSIMKKNPAIDFIIYGEGEESFKEFLTAHKNNLEYEGIKGLIYRRGPEIIKNPERPLIRDLNSIPSPYDESVGQELENRIVYYESSRGCPFNCKFCLSSTIKGVRYFDIERVKRELGILIDAKVRQVKFVDRTFNANKAYAMEIMNYIMDRAPENINFHFEVTAHLLDEEMLEFLSKVKEGLFQFEVGVQSTNDKTIEAVGRTTDFEKLREVTKRIKSYKKIHQHLDLIAGLPYEDYASFKNSFNDVYEIRPEKIQLGFLKLLKGSQLRASQEEYGFKYINRPPYEVLLNKYMGYEDIRRLKLVEEMVENYYNGEIYRHSVEYLVKNKFQTAFDLYESLAKFWESRNYHTVSHSRRKHYDILLEFYQQAGFQDENIFNELLKLDFIENNRGQKLPTRIKTYKMGLGKEDIHELLKNESLLKDGLREEAHLTTRDLIKISKIEKFNYNIFSLIENNYRPEDSMETSKGIYLLTVYRDGVLRRSKSIDVTSIIEEMVE